MNAVNRVLVGAVLAVLGMLGVLAWYGYEPQYAERRRIRAAQRAWLREVSDTARAPEGARSPVAELRRLGSQQVARRTQMASRWQPERPIGVKP